MKRIAMLAVLALAVALVGGVAAQDEKDETAGVRTGPVHPFVPTVTTGGMSPFCDTPNTPIFDNVTFQEVINIPNSFNINDLNVSLDITHTFQGDLEVSISNGVDSVDLIWDDCAGNNDIAATIDDAAAPIACAEPTVGSASTTINNPPQEFLSVFNGQNVNGNWTLTVTDDAGADTGVLNEWCIITDPVVPVELQGFDVQ